MSFPGVWVLIALVAHASLGGLSSPASAAPAPASDRSPPEGRPSSTAPAPRLDANSRLAHRQLVNKAQQGRIDVYFVGDSITRRWGCTDPQYADLLQHWQECFFGWNAANFAWGGDRTENILWRLQNGELDGVNPKVFVVQAGTNNLSGKRPTPALVADVVAGVRAIVSCCRAHAPKAKVLLTAVFPRSDTRDYDDVILEVNRRLSQLDDGDRVKWIDVTDGLTDERGALRDEMAVDGLHLSKSGYQVWADALRPALERLLGPPAAVDLAPPPTGDPSVARPK